MQKPNEDQPTAWFETVYSNSGSDGEGVPWANMETHPHFAAWLSGTSLKGEGKKALVIGCGMGDDALTLESLGFAVTAFDVSPSAIAACKKRFPKSGVTFLVADLFDYPSEWKEAFDFVLEIYTIQALPPKYEAEVIGKVASLVAPGGMLLTAAAVSEGPRSFEAGPPWLLTPDHRQKLAAHGLEIAQTRETEGSDISKSVMVTSFVKPVAL